MLREIAKIRGEWSCGEKESRGKEWEDQKKWKGINRREREEESASEGRVKVNHDEHEGDRQTWKSVLGRESEQEIFERDYISCLIRKMQVLKKAIPNFDKTLIELEGRKGD